MIFVDATACNKYNLESGSSSYKTKGAKTQKLMNASHYQNQALRTLADPSLPLERLNSLGALTALKSIANFTAASAAVADDFKRAIFYGKTDLLPIYPVRDPAKIREAAARLTPQIVNLIHSAIGQLTEAEEFLSAICLHVFEGKPMDLINLREEIGDSLYYLAVACSCLDTDLGAEQVNNIAKLSARYPEKFTEDAALNRDLNAERKAIAG